MAHGKFVSYVRVSTAQQGASGLGLEAQRQAITTYLNGGSWSLIGEHVEVESGKRSDRPALQAAMGQCKLTGATLIVGKLDRLSRNVEFLAHLMNSGVEFVAVDNPSATRFTLHILAAVAEHEAAMISSRTKAALAAAKARGVVLGGFKGTLPDHGKGTDALVKAADEFASKVAPIAKALREQGMSFDTVAKSLTAQHIATARGGAWTATAVRNLLSRVEA